MRLITRFYGRSLSITHVTILLFVNSFGIKIEQIMILPISKTLSETQLHKASASMDTLSLATIQYFLQERRAWGEDWKFKGWCELYSGQQGPFHPANLSISSLDISNVDIIFAHTHCHLHLTTFNHVSWHASCSFEYLFWSHCWRRHGIGCVSFSKEWIMSSEESDSGVGSNSTTTTTTAEQEKLSQNKGESHLYRVILSSSKLKCV